MTAFKGLVTKAADREQVEVAKRRAGEAARQADSDLKTLLSLPEFRRFAYRMLSHTRIYETPWGEGERIHYNIGRQDVGRFLLREIQSVQPEAYIAMQQEALARIQQLERDLNVLTDR